jgi:hypothetical protein
VRGAVCGEEGLALARRGTHAANRVLVGSGLLGSLTVVMVFAVLLPLLGTAAYAAFPWLLLGVGVWLVGSNWPAMWDRPLPQRVLAVCGVVTGAGLCLLMGSIGLAPLVPSPANAPTWITIPAERDVHRYRDNVCGVGGGHGAGARAVATHYRGQVKQIASCHRL